MTQQTQQNNQMSLSECARFDFSRKHKPTKWFLISKERWKKGISRAARIKNRVSK